MEVAGGGILLSMISQRVDDQPPGEEKFEKGEGFEPTRSPAFSRGEKIVRNGYPHSRQEEEECIILNLSQKQRIESPCEPFLHQSDGEVDGRRCFLLLASGKEDRGMNSNSWLRGYRVSCGHGGSLLSALTEGVLSKVLRPRRRRVEDW